MQIMIAEKEEKQALNFQVPRALIQEIDKARKETDTPRTKWIIRAIKQRLEREKAKSEK